METQLIIKSLKYSNNDVWMVFVAYLFFLRFNRKVNPKGDCFE